MASIKNVEPRTTESGLVYASPSSSVLFMNSSQVNSITGRWDSLPASRRYVCMYQSLRLFLHVYHLHFEAQTRLHSQEETL